MGNLRMLLSLVTLFTLLSYLGAATHKTSTAPTYIPALTTPLSTLTLVGNANPSPPPEIIWSPDPSPECGLWNGGNSGNGGELQCCHGSVADDESITAWLAGAYGYQLYPNIVNGLIAILKTSIRAREPECVAKLRNW
ncbi:hypothetical protein F5Y16DRAFT_395435 [Xylariaceae sp. FL0255]|nr:hypothetical protein F5Y16DRAFT_395435 [Xylariaceae sp. FL0255]